MDTENPSKPKWIQQGQETLRRLVAQTERGKTWMRFHGRRVFSKSQNLAAGYHATGPIAFLFTSCAVGMATILTALYTTSYTVTIDGVNMGVVADQVVVLSAISAVEEQGQSILGEDYQVENQVDFEFGLNLKSELSDSSAVEHYLYGKLDVLGQALERYQVKLNGRVIGTLAKEEDIVQVLEDLQGEYTTENTLSADFVEKITIEKVYEGEYIQQEELAETLSANTTGETTYTVVEGDTFNVIAYQNDMSSQDLADLNPDFDPNKLFIGDTLNVKETVPLLSILTTDQEEYTQAIPCPVEDVDDNSIYIGTTKIKDEGTPGEERVVAQVTYLNGREQEREIIETTVIQEPTVTIRAVGTLERPKTASYGSLVWPLRGYISSYFGPRTVYGRYNYHSGIDIPGSYGATIVAADGGTVTFAGWRSSYGNLVILTHDSGMQTYYAHNSSITVSVGQKVYRGQGIAKVGSTGNSTGNHLHFEVRVGGQAVNPLRYLP